MVTFLVWKKSFPLSLVKTKTNEISQSQQAKTKQRINKNLEQAHVTCLKTARACKDLIW